MPRLLAATLFLALAARAGLAQNVEATPPPPPAAPEAEPPPGAAAEERPGVAFNAYASASYNHNFNRPISRRNTLRGFETNDDSFTVDVIELVAQRPVSARGDLGFRADFQAGSAIPRTPAPTEEGGDARKAEDVEIQQAMLSWVAPVGRGLRLDAGKMVSPIAWEVLDGYDGWNDHATTTFLFYGVPFTYTGLKASYPLSDTLNGALYVVNGWDIGADNNEGKSVAALLSWAATPRLQLTANAITGHERDGEDEGARRLVDFVAAWKATDRLTLAANVHLANETDAVGIGNDASWNGVALYGKLLLGDNGAISVRAERFHDGEGVRTGTSQTLTGLTVTPEWRLNDRALFRVDLRFDGSDAPVFEDEEGRLTDGQTTLTLNALVSF
jgi:hypothetical protein